MRYCECGCGRQLDDTVRRGRPRRFFDAACRKRYQRAHTVGIVPVDMGMADRWLRWRLVHRGDGTSKLPVTIDGHPASSTDPSTWTSLPVAEESKVGDGIGFALGSGFACIDLDHCYDSRNHLEPWAKMILAPVAGSTYIETSPSGDGLHIWGLAGERTGVKVRGLMNVEAYSRSRFMTWTGKAFHDAPAKLADLTYLFDVISRLV
jgi:primase-polymerase (primpol)-like protein